MAKLLAILQSMRTDGPAEQALCEGLATMACAIGHFWAAFFWMLWRLTDLCLLGLINALRKKAN